MWPHQCAVHICGLQIRLQENVDELFKSTQYLACFVEATSWTIIIILIIIMIMARWDAQTHPSIWKHVAALFSLWMLVVFLGFFFRFFCTELHVPPFLFSLLGLIFFLTDYTALTASVSSLQAFALPVPVTPLLTEENKLFLLTSTSLKITLISASEMFFLFSLSFFLPLCRVHRPTGCTSPY